MVTEPAIEPVLVIGNGPVGQSAALLLAAWAIPVILLDARPARDPIGSKAICQQRDVLDIWAHVGAGEQIAAEGLTWTRAVTLYRGRELFTQGFVDRGHSPFPPFVNISQSRTEQILDERIAAQPLIDVRWGHRVTGIAQDESGITLRCAIGMQTDTGASDRFETITGSYALACVGARGDLVRGLLGLELAGTTFADQFLICDVRTDLPDWVHERRFHFDPEWNPGRQVLIHPCPDSTFRIDWQVPPEYDLAAEEASGALDARIRRVIGERDYEIVWKSVYRFHSRLVTRMRVGRVLLAGDAAHLVAPFGARGLNSGVPDAENAAEARVRPARVGAAGAARELSRRASRGRGGEPAGHDGDDALPRAAGRGAVARAPRDPRGGEHRRGRPGAGRLRPARRAVLVCRLTPEHPVRASPGAGSAAEGRRAAAVPGRARARRAGARRAGRRDPAAGAGPTRGERARRRRGRRRRGSGGPGRARGSGRGASDRRPRSRPRGTPR